MWRVACLLCLLGCSARRLTDVHPDAQVASPPSAPDAVEARRGDADVTALPETLHEAARRCDHGGVVRLLALGHDLRARNAEGRTPLHDAAARCSRTVVELLVTAGADVNARDGDGMTPLHEACSPSRTGTGAYAIWRGGDAAVVAVLLARGADPRAATPTGWTPLHAATQVPQGGGEIIEILLDHGAHIDAPDLGGWTPLHHAARFDAVSATGVLVARGASLDARTGVPRTLRSRFFPPGSRPLDIARAGGAKRAIELLERR
jgi:ankyrin repeat protein